MQKSKVKRDIFNPTCHVSVPYRLRDGLLDRLSYFPKWEPETKRWEIYLRDEPRIRQWLDAEMAPPWKKGAA